jgi:hypothetical protein
MATVANETFGREELHSALRGEPSDIEIYWDASDPQDPGPAWRTPGDERGGCESGPLDVCGWASLYDDTVRQHIEGYQVAHYFDGHGAYRGPDAEGIYPDME